jgi:hypothetical protein
LRGSSARRAKPPMQKPLNCRVIANGKRIHDPWDTVLPIQMYANHEIAEQ